jgi:hypothetical protein
MNLPLVMTEEEARAHRIIRDAEGKAFADMLDEIEEDLGDISDLERPIRPLAGSFCDGARPDPESSKSVYFRLGNHRSRLERIEARHLENAVSASFCNV